MPNSAKVNYYETDPACDGCKFQSIYGYCQYTIITGHCRSLICKHGKDCTVREVGDRLTPTMYITLNGTVYGIKGGRRRKKRKKVDKA